MNTYEDPYRPSDPNPPDRPVDNSPGAWVAGIFWLVVSLLVIIGLTTVMLRLAGG